MQYSLLNKEQSTVLELQSVEVVKLPDDSPDLSWLGEYSSTPQGVHVDRQERGDMDRGTHRYFNGGNANDSSLSPEEQQKVLESDYRRMEDYGNGWICIGIRAVATVHRKVNAGVVQVHAFESAGVWGIESDSDDGYFHELGTEELADLKEQLDAFGVDVAEFDDLTEYVD